MVADTYVPSRISGAVQLRDLTVEMVRQGHQVTMLVPDAALQTPWATEVLDGVRVLRVKAPQSKDVGLVRRALAEILLPLVLLRGLHSSGLGHERWGGVVWYSPTIFLGLVARQVKRRSGCHGYLIVRDLFPDWAVDAGVMRKGLAYHFFKAVERFQYAVADTIGVQTPANVALVSRDAPSGARIEVLHNWLAESLPSDCDAVAPHLGDLEGRTVFVYAGNMGVAQDMDAFVELAGRMVEQEHVGFLFVGRGSEVPRLRELVASRKLANVLIMEEIDSNSIPALLKKCHVGIVALDPRHTTHNIPGKFVAYARNGLPVLARVNPGNDLVGVINEFAVGRVVEGDSIELLHAAAQQLVDSPDEREAMRHAGQKLAEHYFTPASAVAQIVAALSRGHPRCE